MKLVSIIIPYYKKRNYIHRAIKSILKQSYKKFEIINTKNVTIIEIARNL